MNDKLVAMLVTFVIVLPLYAMCCLGPAAVIGSVGGLVGSVDPLAWGSPALPPARLC